MQTEVYGQSGSSSIIVMKQTQRRSGKGKLKLSELQNLQIKKRVLPWIKFSVSEWKQNLKKLYSINFLYLGDNSMLLVCNIRTY